MSRKLVKVAEVFLVQDGEEFVGLEMAFTESVLNAQGRAGVLDALRGSLDNSLWVAGMISRESGGSSNDSEVVEGASPGGGEAAGDDDAGA